MGIKTLPHPAYSLDLAPCDFWLFPKLRGCRYEKIEEMKETVTKVIVTLTQEEFYGALQKFWNISLETYWRHLVYIYIYIYIYIERERERERRYYSTLLKVFHTSVSWWFSTGVLSDSNSPQVFRTLLSILADPYWRVLIEQNSLSWMTMYTGVSTLMKEFSAAARIMQSSSKELSTLVADRV